MKKNRRSEVIVVSKGCGNLAPILEKLDKLAFFCANQREEISDNSNKAIQARIEEISFLLKQL